MVQHNAARCMTSKERLTINLEHDESSEIEALAKQHNVSKAWIGRQAIIRLLKQYKQREFQFPLDIDQRTGT